MNQEFAYKHPLFLFLETLSLVGVFAFLSGWAYITSYFSIFQLTASSLDFSIHYYFLYSIAPIKSLKFVVLLLFFLLYLIFRIYFKNEFEKYFIGVSDVIILLSAAPIIYWISATKGLEDAQERKFSTNNDLPRISIQIDDDRRDLSQDRNCDARLLLFNNDIFYVFCALDGNKTRNIKTNLIPVNKVNSASIFRK